MTMPEVAVAVAFNAGYATPAASRVWTDITQYVEARDELTAQFGRGDELAEADANTLSLTLDNTDGRFTAGLSTSPYYPNVKIGRPVRVTVTPTGQPATTAVFFVDEWPTEWPGGSASYAKTTITCSSQMSRLGLNDPLSTLPANELAAGALPYEVYAPLVAVVSPLTEVESGVAVKMEPPPDGVAPATDGLPLAKFTEGGRQLELGFRSAASRTAALLFRIPSTDGDIYELWSEHSNSDERGRLVRVETVSGSLSLVNYTVPGPTPISATSTGSGFNDGELHSLVIVTSASSVIVYVDGVQQITALASSFPDAWTRLGGIASVLGNPSSTGAAQIGRFLWDDSAWSLAQAQEYDQIVRLGFPGESPSDRLARYASYASVADTSFTGGTAPIAHIDTTDRTVLDLMRTVARTDGGALFDAPDGTLTYRGREDRYDETSAQTFDMSAQEVEAGYAPKLDRSTLVNEARATAADGTEFTATDQTSIDEYGRHSAALELATDDYDDVEAAAWWRVNTYAEPEARVPTLAVDLAPLSSVRQAEILALTVGSQITVTNHPSQARATSEDYFVEGWAWEISPDAFRIVFNLSPTGSPVWIVEHPTQGVLTSCRIAY